MKPVKIAILGAGNMARAHALAFANVPGTELVGIFSRTHSRAEEVAAQYRIKTVYDSIADMYQQSQAELVVVTVSGISMKNIAVACLEFPWTVFLEKPPGLNLAEGEEIQAVAQSKQRRVFVGLNRRFLTSTRMALNDLAQYDSPRFIHVQDQQSLDEAASYGHPEAVVQHWMYANSIHLIDYLTTFGRGGVKCVTPIIPWNPQIPQVVLAKVDFSSGDIGLYEGVWNGPGPWAVSVTTPEKRWEMRPLEKACYQRRGERQLYNVEPHAWDIDFKPGFRMQAEHVVDVVRAESSAAVTLDTALKTIRLIKDIFGNVHNHWVD